MGQAVFAGRERTPDVDRHDGVGYSAIGLIAPLMPRMAEEQIDLAKRVRDGPYLWIVATNPCRAPLDRIRCLKMIIILC